MATRRRTTTCDGTGEQPRLTDATGCGLCSCGRWFRLTKAGLIRWHKAVPGQTHPRRAVA